MSACPLPACHEDVETKGKNDNQKYRLQSAHNKGKRLLGPLSHVGVPAHEIAMMMSIALRFIPTLLEETDKIMKAQQARGADFESGNILNRASKSKGMSR